jgi:hypothetical protein
LHERRRTVYVKYLVRNFSEHNRREWPKPFPPFDPLIYERLHIGMARVRQDGSVPQRTRTGLTAAVIQADSPSAVEQLHYAVNEVSWSVQQEIVTERCYALIHCVLIRFRPQKIVHPSKCRLDP